MCDKDKIFRIIVQENISEISKAATYSYTKSYFWWKKIKNVVTLFREEMGNKGWKVNVLDVGCGNGFNIFYLNSYQGKNKKVFFTGVDLSHSRIFYANERKKITRTNNINFEVGDAMALSFPEATFDIVICTEVLEHLPDPKLCVSELFRVLKPGGLAIITTPNPENVILKLGRVLKAFHQMKDEPKITSEYTKDTFNISRVGYGHISVKSYAEWERLFKICGFKIEKRKRGGLLFGGPRYDNHRFLFIFIMLLEIALDRIPFWWNLSEDITLSLRKPKIPERT